MKRFQQFFRLFIALAACTIPFGARAQATIGSTVHAEGPVPPETFTPDEIDKFLALLPDNEVRQLLRDQLLIHAETSAETQATADGLIGSTLQVVQHIFASTVDAVSKIPALFSGQIEAFGNFYQSYGGFSGTTQLFGLILAALAFGFVVERVVTMVTRRWQSEVPQGSDATIWQSVDFLLRRFMREIVGLIGFYVGLRVMGAVFFSEYQLQFAAPFVFYLIWLPRIGMALSRLILAPKRSDLRLVNATDAQAEFLSRNLIGLILLAGFTVFIGQFNDINGVPLETTRLGYWLNLSVHLYIIFIAWKGRDGLTAMMLGSDPEDNSNFDEAVARNFPIFAVLVSVAMWLTVYAVDSFGYKSLLAGAPHYVTMLWLLIAPALDTLVRAMVKHLQPPMVGEGPIAEEAYRSTKRSFIRIGRVIVGGVVLLIIAKAWQINLFSLRGQDTIGANIFQFALTLAIGYVIYEGVSLWINRRLAREQTTSEGSEDQAAGEGGGAGGTRLATVLPLVRVTAQVAIAVVFVLLALGNLGIDITPLLAGAGILGLAIGFGAQKLVADIVGGIFFLIDDAFRVGEYIDVGGTMGSVEKISVRSMQLRHHRGNVHTIPYGSIDKVTNFSRDWVIMKLMFTVPFDTDPNKVKKIFKKIGAEMMEDPLFKDGFLEPFKSQGVFQFDDVGIVMRGKFMAKPGTQFTIRKEIYNRVRAEFDANGIEFARREVRVAMPGGEDIEDLSPDQKSALQAGVSGAVQAGVESEKQARSKE